MSVNVHRRNTAAKFPDTTAGITLAARARDRVTLRGRLVRTMVVVLGLTASATLIVVAAMNIVSSRATLRTVEANIWQSIVEKGDGLVRNQALGLRDLVTDNAFGDVARLIERTVQQDPSIVYGVFLGDDLKPWGYTLGPAAAAVASAMPAADQWRALGVEPAKPREAGVRTRTRTILGQSVLEFTAAVVDDRGAFLGSLSYALSKRRLEQALSDARAAASSALVTTVGLLLLIGAVTIAAGVLLTRRAAERIVRPLSKLSRAAHMLADGQRTFRVNIQGGDELAMVGEAFNKMAAELEESYARLQDLNQKLEVTIEARTRELAARNRDIRLVLENVSQGLITVDATGALAPERSMPVDRWFGPFAPGTPFIEYIGRVDRAYADSFAVAFKRMIEAGDRPGMVVDAFPRVLRHLDREYRCRYVPLAGEQGTRGILVILDESADARSSSWGDTGRHDLALWSSR